MTKSRRPAPVDHRWLGQIETEGPFLALPVVKSTWPNGVERLGKTDERAVLFKQAFNTWLRGYDRQTTYRDQYTQIARDWIDIVLDDLVGWAGLRLSQADVPAEIEIHSPGEQIRIRPDGALWGRDHGEIAALIRVAAPAADLRGPGLDGWAATEIDRTAALLRKAGVEVGIVTDGRWWAIVWAKAGKPTGSGIVDAITWAEEPLLRDAFLTLIDQRRFRAKDAEERLTRLLERSELEAEEITEKLGTQVRSSVELLVQSFSEARVVAAQHGDPDPLPAKPDEIYQAAVTIMMRVVFLLFAEERGMLPTEQLYWDSYAIRDVLADLRDRAAGGEEHLDESHDTWHRLLAVSQALHGGVNYDEMRIPSYGGSLLDPARFPWLAATDERGLRLRVSDRVMLHVLESVQYAQVGGEARRISFNDIDVEQIGYIYEGLLGYTCRTVEDDAIIGLVGKDKHEGEEPDISLDALSDLYDGSSGTKDFVAALLDWFKTNQPGAKPKTANQLAKLVGADVDEPELRRLLTPIAGHNPDLLASLVSWGNLIRRDLRGIPLVIPRGGLVVVETPSRKNAGAHYTPRSLAEEVVKHALEPLVYEPGPLQTLDEDTWTLKTSTAILDLRVADIAAGSGAFLVAAARFLADRLTEAWFSEGLVDAEERAHPQRVKDRAIREVIARCLYGADINPMAVEMCKLSLWLVSLDRSKPFSFVDDKIFCGNSLLGVTTLDQLRYLQIEPKNEEIDLLHTLVDVDAKLAEAARIRREIANPVDEHDPVRSTDAKLRQLQRANAVTDDLRTVADGIIAAALSRKGGGRTVSADESFVKLEVALAQALASGSTVSDRDKLVAMLDHGLKPDVDTDFTRWKPLHWVIEAPQVLLGAGGFDAIIGNPPFMGVKNIRGAIGHLRDFLADNLAEGETGRSDYAVFFLLRSAQLARQILGLIIPESLSAGDGQRFGSGLAKERGWNDFMSTPPRKWPTSNVTVRISLLWMTKYGAPIRRPDSRGGSQGEGSRLRIINPAKIFSQSPLPRGYQATIVLGKSLVLSRKSAEELIELDVRIQNWIRPYMSGDDLVAAPWPSASRVVLDLGGATEVELAEIPALQHFLVSRVYPERQMQFAKYPTLRRKWWGFLSPVNELYRDLSGLESAVAITKHSKHIWPVRVDVGGQVFSNGLIVYPTDSLGAYAFLASDIHRRWSIRAGGTRISQDHRYNPSRLRQTFPFPDSFDGAAAAGKELAAAVESAMNVTRLGITGVINSVGDPECNRGEIAAIRNAFEAVNVVVSQLCGIEVPMCHGFYRYADSWRYGIDLDTEQHVVAALLEENHRRARLKGQDVPEYGELV